MKIDVAKYLQRRYPSDGCYALVADVYLDNGLCVPDVGVGSIAKKAAAAKRKWHRRQGDTEDGDVLLCITDGAPIHAAIRVGSRALHVRRSGQVVLEPIERLAVDSAWHLGGFQ